MEIANAKHAEETYSKWHKDTLIEEYLQKKTSAEVEAVLVSELESRGVDLEKIHQFVKKNKLDEYLNGITYENIALRTDRVMAYLIDGFLIFCLFVALTIISLIGKIDYEITSSISLLIYWFYSLIKDALPNGQSFGKKSMHIKVISRKTSKNCTIFQSIIRNVFTFIPFLNIADAMMAGKPKRERIGDILAGTIVVDVAK
jgi:uncharacterized RDD family membrane protein YckC